MEKFASAAAYVAAKRPTRPTLAARPHAAARAARWFLKHFPGDVAYAYKANASVFLLGALYGAGIRHFDVASLAELEDAVTIPNADLHFMHPVKARHDIHRAYHDFGIKTFAIDSAEELAKIVEETRGRDGPARDLNLFVRIIVPAINSRIPLEHKFGVAGEAAAQLLVETRQVAQKVGITFHVGSQTTTPDAFAIALEEVNSLIKASGVVIDRLDVGGGFPSIYPDSRPQKLKDFVDVIDEGVEKLPVREDIEVMCEPGRALVAEAESLIVRVDARRDNELFINDGAYGILFDAAHLNFVFPARVVSRDIAERDELQPFALWGPTCDSIDYMEGPFQLPASVREGDYIEIGNIGAYGRAMATRFNGYGAYDDVILLDEPMLSIYDAEDCDDENIEASSHSQS
jgi:ornithine decarboxylase